MDYRRAWHPGGTYFFTVNCLQRHNNDLLIRHIEALREVIANERRSDVGIQRRERGIWQRRYWEH